MDAPVETSSAAFESIFGDGDEVASEAPDVVESVAFRPEGMPDSDSLPHEVTDDDD